MYRKRKSRKSIIYLNANKYDWNLYSTNDHFSYWDAHRGVLYDSRTRRDDETTFVSR